MRMGKGFQLRGVKDLKIYQTDSIFTNQYNNDIENESVLEDMYWFDIKR